MHTPKGKNTYPEQLVTLQSIPNDVVTSSVSFRFVEINAHIFIPITVRGKTLVNKKDRDNKKIRHVHGHQMKQFKKYFYSSKEGNFQEFNSEILFVLPQQYRRLEVFFDQQLNELPWPAQMFQDVRERDRISLKDNTFIQNINKMRKQTQKLQYWY